MFLYRKLVEEKEENALEMPCKTHKFCSLRTRKRKGFWSVEMALCFAIALGFILYLFTGSSLFGASDSTAAKTDMRNLSTYVRTYQSQRKDHKLPDSLDDLLTGVSASESASGKDEAAIINPDTRNEILDPWGNEYEYNVTADGSAGTITCTMGGEGSVTVNF